MISTLTFSFQLPKLLDLINPGQLAEDKISDFLLTYLAMDYLHNLDSKDEASLNQIIAFGQSYNHLTLINYDSRVVPDLKTLHITTLGS